jgi:hypothetical protein
LTFSFPECYNRLRRGAVAQLGARLDGIEEVVGSNPIGSTIHKGGRNCLSRHIAAHSKAMTYGWLAGIVGLRILSAMLGNINCRLVSMSYVDARERSAQWANLHRA